MNLKGQELEEKAKKPVMEFKWPILELHTKLGSRARSAKVEKAAMEDSRFTQGQKQGSVGWVKMAEFLCPS